MYSAPRVFIPLPNREASFLVIDNEGWNRLLADPVTTMADTVTAAQLLGYIVREDEIGHA